METLKRYLMSNFEQALVLVIMTMVALVIYYIPQKIAFLNFFYIPVLISAYYLGPRMGMLGAIFTILMVAIYAVLYPDLFYTMKTNIDLAMALITWSGFLLISSLIVGKLTLRLKDEIQHVAKAQRDLQDKKTQLDIKTNELTTFTHQMDQQVAQRTYNIERSKQVLEQHKQKVEEALYLTMDPSVVKLLIDKRLRTEKRHISVMFSDLKGFTRYSEKNPAEVVVTNLNRYLSAMEAILLDYHAHIDKYMGDGIMVEFGAPIDYERYALHAVLCGIKMQESMHKADFPWLMRVGIASGESIISLTGHKRQFYTTLGDTVNLASRIEGVCTPGRVTVDEKTYKQTKLHIDYTLKTLQHTNADIDEKLLKAIADSVSLLKQQPDNFDLLKHIGMLFLQSNDIQQANDYFARTLRLNPDDNEVKIAYADSSIKAQEQGSFNLHGKERPIRLYEAKGIKDPLLNYNRLPKSVYDRYTTEISELIEYPEETLLPVESIEGAVLHSKMVGFIAYVLADKLELPYQTKKDILEAGYFADYGKSIISHHILNRRGTLSTDEFEYIKLHPQESVRKLRLLGYNNRSVFDYIESHHEAYNGGGYPKGLSGDEIPIGGRVIALAEAYSSLTAWRPYREQWECKAAIMELEKNTNNGKYDPSIMQTLADMFV